jgi:predicted transcriptional regulator
VSEKAIRKQLDSDYERHLRKEMMRRPKLLRDLVLSDAQEKLINFVSSRYWVFATEVAKEFRCSVQSASGRLAVLAKKGYLVRQKTTHNSGGLEYRYMTFQRQEYLESIPKQNRSLRCG